jgi:hypothetical protein
LAFPTPIFSAIALPGFRLEIHDRGKRFGIQARAAYQRAINLRLGHQTLDIVGFDAAAVEDANR